MAYFEQTVFETLWRTLMRRLAAPVSSRRKQVLEQRATLRRMSDDELRLLGLTRDDLRDEMFRTP